MDLFASLANAVTQHHRVNIVAMQPVKAPGHEDISLILLKHQASFLQKISLHIPAGLILFELSYNRQLLLIRVLSIVRMNSPPLVSSVCRTRTSGISSGIEISGDFGMSALSKEARVMTR